MKRSKQHSTGSEIQDTHVCVCVCVCVDVFTFIRIVCGLATVLGFAVFETNKQNFVCF